MRELFYEESAINQNQKSESFKYNILRVLSIFSWVLLFLWVCFCLFFLELLIGNVFLNIIIALLPATGFIASAIFLGRFKNKYCIDYDYTFISGEVRISKVIKSIKRRQVIIFSTSAIEMLGKVGSDTFNGYNNSKSIKKVFLTSNTIADEEKDFYYIVLSQGEKKLLILECTQTFIYNIIKFSNRSVIEKDFK